MEGSGKVSLPTGSDPIDRLRAADPAHADDLPDASIARVTARTQEHVMSDKQFDPTIRPTRGPLAVVGGLALIGVFALAIAFGAGGFGTKDPGPIGAGPSPTENPAAGGGGVASCLVYEAANVPNNEVAFDGTVTAVDGDQVTFDVNEGWKGAEGSITLTAPVVDVAISGPIPDFEVGGRYLVTANGGTISACGYTLDYDADTAAEWEAAFAG
jgi:hypothetical protein